MDKKILTETLKKYNQLLEYNFYLPSDNDDLDEQTTVEDPNPEDPTADPNTADATADPNLGDPNLGDQKTDQTTNTEEIPVDNTNVDNSIPPVDDAPPVDNSMVNTDVAPIDSPIPTDNTPSIDNSMQNDMNSENGEDIEVDITDLVSSTEDSNQKLDGVNQALNNILQKFGELETKISSVDQVISKIDSVEKEVEKRLPTPVEKLELRSLDSFPYNLKLSDFWDNKNEELGISDKVDDPEFVLTQDKVMDDYDPMSIKSSFDVGDEEIYKF